jgi:hypothetical protein
MAQGVKNVLPQKTFSGIGSNRITQATQNLGEADDEALGSYLIGP